MASQRQIKARGDCADRTTDNNTRLFGFIHLRNNGKLSSAQQRQPNQRAYERYAVNLSAECTLPDTKTCPCTILNLCAGGMYIDLQGHPALTQGELLTIRVMAPQAAVDEPKPTISLITRIVRREGQHCGLALMDPACADILTLIERVSKQSPATVGPTSSAKEKQPRSDRGEILVECRQIIIEQIPTLLTDFTRIIRDELFKSAEASHHASEQNAYFSALSIFNDQSEHFTEQVLANIDSALQQAPCQEPQDSAEDSTEDTGQLTLMGDEEVEEWLATTDIISLAERLNQTELTALEQRLDTLFELPVNADNNPFRPLIFANEFLSALEKMGLETVATHCCHHVFRKLLAETCEVIYPELNAYLIKCNILPRLHFKVGKKKKVRQKTAEPVDNLTEAAETKNNEADAASQQPATTENTTTDTRSPGEKSGRDIYQIVNELEGLRHDLQQQALQVAGKLPKYSQQAENLPPQQQRQQAQAELSGQVATAIGKGHSNTGLSDQTDSDAETYSLGDIFQALDSLQLSPPIDPAENHAGVYPQLDALLRTQFGDERQIESHQRSIINVGGRLFSSLLDDQIVSGQVKDWLKRLEVPLLKLALQDDSLFTDKSHIARQIVNQVAKLEVYGDDEGRSGHSPVLEEVDRLLSRIDHSDNIDESVLKKVLRKLDMLIAIQDDAYGANLDEVVSGCDKEQQVRADGIHREHELQLLAVKLSPPTTTNNNDDIDAHWRDKVAHLRPDTWILFIDQANKPRRLKLAWISKHRDRFVLVNLRGLRELTLTDQQLAQSLRDNTAFILEDAEEPALDRAQYAMLQQLHRQLLHETTHDPVTGLINRHEFESRLSNTIRELHINGHDGSFSLIDIDQFRIINDACGSTEGDKLLHQFARQLRQHYGDDAVIARLGNDDFAILSTQITSTEAKKKLETLSIDDFHFQTKCYPVDFSAIVYPLIGLAANEEPTALISSAKDLCRQARNRGEAISIFSAQLEDKERKRSLTWLTKVNNIISHDERLSLRYQPIVPISGDQDEPHHSEILLAMKDEQGRIVSPQEFVLAAERFHKMPVIDRLVVNQVMNWLREHPDLFELTGSLAINLSGHSLNEKAFRSFLVDEVRNAGVPAERICFEVTETAGIDSLRHAADFINEIRDLGCQFSLDDFGSGMSSYGYLRQLPVDFLKIDGIFIKDLDQSPEDFAIVKSITEIGHFLGKKIIAEYVENETILERLREIGVDYAQGYHFGKPRFLSELETASLTRVGGHRQA